MNPYDIAAQYCDGPIVEVQAEPLNWVPLRRLTDDELAAIWLRYSDLNTHVTLRQLAAEYQASAPVIGRKLRDRYSLAYTSVVSARACVRPRHPSSTMIEAALVASQARSLNDRHRPLNR